ncbi:MAG: terpene cyclase/mutase family protein [Kiritimatiellae bacterium]|nr:terpene cyclase/mutase family protein [Kiritimatiellia bacterium]
MKRFFATVLAAVATLAAFGDEALEQAIQKGAQFLLANQSLEGYWSDKQMPALTALPVWALSGSGLDKAITSSPIEKGVKYVLSTQREDGGFYIPKPGRGGSGLGNYNTSVCLSSLYESGIAPTAPMLKAREYIASSQLTGDDTMAGGFGYDKISRRRYADLSNTSYALDAMHRTAALEEVRTGSKKVDVDWDRALQFVSNLISQEGQSAGGAAYNERTPQGGVETNAQGRVTLRAYGSMTYAAVLSMCHAKLDRGDPRVRQSLEYCEKYWSLDENPGMGNQGLFYYFDILSRALTAAKVEKVGEHEWKKELAAKVISLQNPDGSWVNDNNRFWEGDKVLCTSFALLVLELCR